MMTSHILSEEKSRIWDYTSKFLNEVFKRLRSFNNHKLTTAIRRTSLLLSTALNKSFQQSYGKEYIRSLAIANGACIELDTLIYKGISQQVIEENIGIYWLEQLNKITRELFTLTRYHN